MMNLLALNTPKKLFLLQICLNMLTCNFNIVDRVKENYQWICEVKHKLTTNVKSTKP